MEMSPQYPALVQSMNFDELMREFEQHAAARAATGIFSDEWNLYTRVMNLVKGELRSRI